MTTRIRLVVPTFRNSTRKPGESHHTYFSYGPRDYVLHCTEMEWIASYIGCIFIKINVLTIQATNYGAWQMDPKITIVI